MQSLVSEWELAADPQGSIVVRTTTFRGALEPRVMPTAVVAADLAASHDARERAVGRRELGRMLR
jgi:hypothetical protein